MADFESEVTCSDQDSGTTRVVAVRGHFDFSVHRSFREAYKDSQGIEQYLVDLRETIYIDSSALGMLLLLREYAQGQGAAVVIRNASRDVRNILEIANFQKLFPIEG